MYRLLRRRRVRSSSSSLRSTRVSSSPASLLHLVSPYPPPKPIRICTVPYPPNRQHSHLVPKYLELETWITKIATLSMCGGYGSPIILSGGCTIQACGFRDSYPQYTGIDYEIYCLSADPPSEQTSWQSDVRLPLSLFTISLLDLTGWCCII